MKKVTVILKTLVLLIMSTSAMANTNSALNVSVESNHMMISLETSSDQLLEIKIQDGIGQVVYSERGAKRAIENKKYDLASLPEGRYMVEVSQGNTTRVQPIIKGFDGVSVDQSKVLTYFAPVYNQMMGHVDMNLLCSIDFDTSIRIIDANGHVLYAENVEAGGKVQKRFDLSQLEGGAYTFAVEISSPMYEDSVYKTFEVADMQASL